MNKIILLEPFSKWLRKLKDPIAKARIISRLEQAKNGNFGDSKPIISNIQNFLKCESLLVQDIGFIISVME